MLKKKFLKTKCKVEFSFRADIVKNTDSIYLVGDFNQWNETATPMQREGDLFKLTLDLALNQAYQFRYLINGTTWHNDWEADMYVPNVFGGDNSVVSTHPSV